MYDKARSLGADNFAAFLRDLGYPGYDEEAIRHDRLLHVATTIYPSTTIRIGSQSYYISKQHLDARIPWNEQQVQEAENQLKILYDNVYVSDFQVRY